MQAKPLDCLIVGGGPAGLTAAIYAARFRLSVKVVDAGSSRAALIPCTRNHAGFPEGVSGAELVLRMRRQAVCYGALFEHGRVESLERTAQGFLARTASAEISSLTVLLATGVTNRRPPMGDDLHQAAVAAGRLRYCPVCDGFEVMDQHVAVIGVGARGFKEALFLRGYSRDITLIDPEGPPSSASERACLAEAGVKVLAGSPRDFRLTPMGLSFLCDRQRLSFAAVYAALGSDIHSQLAAQLKAEITSDGCVKVDDHQRTSAPGLYAAGDVVIGLDQISHAMGEAGVAATAIRNDLAEIEARLR